MDQIKPLHYSLNIDPDLQSFTFHGQVRIDLFASSMVGGLRLDARQLEIDSVELMSSSGNRACDFKIDESAQKLILLFPDPMQGDFSVHIAYRGSINNQYAGFYRSRYHREGADCWIFSTQFEARDARRAFPCFDEPAFKATFEIELIAPQGWTGISNAPLIEETLLEEERRSLRFERTPPLSTYLVFFAVGEFEFLEDAASEPLIRVAVTPGKTDYAKFGLEMARQSLKFGEDYTGIRYPMAKCDYIAIPDSMGAMENFGAIRHSEEDLLVYPGITPPLRAILIAKIIAHEAIHMWFGDMVSPAAWKYIWLNEAFATYFTYVIPHAIHPEWDVWQQFFHERMLTGLERDSLDGSPPINLPSMDDPEADPAPTPSTAPIVYNKGAAVLRMLNTYLGEDRFRLAIRGYLQKHLHRAATADQFWQSIEASSGEPVDEFASSWTDQAGYPLVTVESDHDGLILSQQRFSYFSLEEMAGLWVIPLSIRFFLDDGSIRAARLPMRERSIKLPLPAGTHAYHLNAELSGFFRIHHLPSNLLKLGSMMREKSLPATDSLGILSDHLALVKAGRYPLDDHIQFIETFLSNEIRPLVLIEIANQLSYLYRVVRSRRPAISHLGTLVLEQALDRIGMLPGQNESVMINELRTALLNTLLLFGSAKILSFGKEQFQALIEGQSVPANLLPIVQKIGASSHCQAREWLTRRAADPDLPEAERGMSLEALGSGLLVDDLQSALVFNLKTPRNLQRRLWIEAARNPACMDWMWTWVSNHLPDLESLPASHLPGVLVGMIPFIGIGNRPEVESGLKQLTERDPSLGISIDMALELLEVNERLSTL